METKKNEIAMYDDSSLPVAIMPEKSFQDAGSFGYYTVKELANIIGFHKDTVYEWIAKKGMPARRSGFKGRITVHWPEFIKWWSRNREEEV